MASGGLPQGDPAGDFGGRIARLEGLLEDIFAQLRANSVIQSSSQVFPRRGPRIIKFRVTR